MISILTMVSGTHPNQPAGESFSLSPAGFFIICKPFTPQGFQVSNKYYIFGGSKNVQFQQS